MGDASRILRLSPPRGLGTALFALLALSWGGTAFAKTAQGTSSPASCRGLSASQCRRLALVNGEGQVSPDRPRSMLYVAAGCKSREDRECRNMVTLPASGR